MKVILTSIVAAIVLGIAAGFVLQYVQKPASTAYSTVSTRVGEPGQNLVH